MVKRLLIILQNSSENVKLEPAVPPYEIGMKAKIMSICRSLLLTIIGWSAIIEMKDHSTIRNV